MNKIKQEVEEKIRTEIRSGGMEKKKRGTLKQIVERLERIEDILKAHYPQDICGHEWVTQNGTSTYPMYCCHKCGKIKMGGSIVFDSTDGQ